ncbi:hypothetical protein KIN20_033257 [Parelaphostrongylus tenuis]|uniref:SH2 domain-containing protein n=1 Tax=Parelaphostrongylus tenuis TaxID=148309 RepID=A0AAD5R7W7_PARTN|nr:hypothetical protein KIN20_033257 [Parelaphostrongylus tenuis]
MLPTNEIATSLFPDVHDDSSMQQSTSSSSSRLQVKLATPPDYVGRPWYHGEISQAEAETLLEDAKPGRFLVRKAGPARYFLSCVTDNHLLLHLPINQLGRFFYLNAGKYATLAEAVRHHCEMVEMAEPVHVSLSNLNKSIMQAHHNAQTRRFLSLSNCDLAAKDELGTSKGDVITQIQALENCYILARNEKTGQTGHLSSKSLDPILSESSSVQELPYFHSVVTTDQLKMLTRMGPGAFLVRSSSQGADAFALLVHTQDKIEKFLIRGGGTEDFSGFLLAGRRFPSLQHIIDRYCVHPIANNVRLTHAVLSPASWPSLLPTEEHGVAVIPGAITTSEWSSNAASVEATDDYFNHNCASNTVAAVQALRKSREEKAWKPCWLTLCDDPNDGCELFITDTELSAKVRIVLDLAYCVMYLLDDSVFSREGCIFFSQTDIDLPGVYLCFRPTHVLIKWLELLRPRVLGLRVGTVPVLRLSIEAPKHSSLAVLQLHINKYRSESLKQDGCYSAHGLICGVKVCNTPVVAASVGKGGLPSVIFDCSFLLPLLPPENGTLQFSVLSHSGGGKRARPLGVSALLSLPDSLPYSDSPELGLTFRATQYHFRVLAQEHYAPLLEYLRDETANLFDWASEALSVQQRSLLCWSIVSLLLPSRDELLHLISRLLRRVLAVSSAESVMRQDSFTTTLLTQALRIAGRSQLEDAFDAIGVANMKLLQPTEVDHIIAVLDKLVSPCSLVYDLLIVVARLASERFPDEPHLVRRVLSTVYILRFANPLLISYMNGNPMNQQLAKAVQSAANSAAAASPRVEDVTVGSQCLRALFERIRISEVALPTKPSCLNNAEPRCCDWMAMICHLLFLALVSRKRPPQIEPSFLQLIHAHKSSFP